MKERSVGIWLNADVMSGIMWSRYHELKSDDLTLTYSAPHWKASDPGELLFPGAQINALAGARNYSLAYTSGSTATIAGKFKLAASAPANLPYKIRATSTGGITIPETLLTSAALGDLILAPTASTTAFPASISKFYDKSTAVTAFNLNWELSVNNGVWTKLITTYHQLYLTKNDPALVAAIPPVISLPGNLETAFYLACHLSNGKTQNDDIVTAIYDEFTDRKVYGIHKITGQPAGATLNYYGPAERIEFQKRSGHLLTSGQAQCGGWADFLRQVISIHGIAASTVNLSVKSGVSSSYGADGTIRNGVSTFVLKPVVIPLAGTDSAIPLGDPPFFFSGGSRIISPSQGTGNDKRLEWVGHSITGYNSMASGMMYFDPSYGTPRAVAGSGFTAEQQFTFGLAGYRGTKVFLTTSYYRWWCVDSANHELTFTIAP